MPSSYDRLNCSGAGHPRAEPLPGGFPSLTKGLCAAFHVTDCLQVLSLVGGAPTHLHVFDPGGTFLFNAEAPPAHAAAAAAGSAAAAASDAASAASSAAVSASAAPPVARRYALGSAKSSPGLVARFPDQFAPFAAHLAAAGSSSSGSRGVSTVLRLPLRLQGSAVSPCAPDAASTSAALVGLEPTLRACLVVAKSLGAVYVDHWPPHQAPAAAANNNTNGGSSGGSGALPCARLVFSVALRASPLAPFFPRSGDAKGSGGASSGSGASSGGHAFREPDDARARRRALLEDREAWARRGLLSVFTKFVPPKDLYAVDVAVTRRERVGVATADRGDSGLTFVFLVARLICLVFLYDCIFCVG
jgi:hypothetical protein